MDEEKLGHSNPEDIAPSGSSTGDELQQASTDSKGKQKAGLELAASQLGASTKMVVNAITTFREMPALASESKFSHGSSSTGSLSSIAGEYSSYKPLQNPLLDETTHEGQDGLFETFTKSSTDALVNDGYQVGIPGSSFADQEASDGLAVLELLSQPGNESIETAISQEHDFQISGEDESWSEAVAGTLIDEEDQLDFTPDFITNPELSSQAAPYLGTTNIEETSSTWFGYWSDVFTAYNARVWGNLHPISTSETSDQELEQGQDSRESMTINRALDRLKLIFYHLRG